jgi:NAD(P)-dependent dehydrogenase (short-subunit alcohol dehydrogenase family)
MRRVDGKVALVTGGGSGIGLAASRRLAAEGAYVFLVGRRGRELETAAEELAPNARAVPCDVSKLADLDHLYATVKEAKGRIDILFANAGVAENGALGAITEEEFDRMFAVNVKGTLFTVQQALPLLSDRASIILTGSVVGSRGFADRSVYSATKAALRSFARTWTSDLKARRIRVNVVSPGSTDTPGLRRLTGMDGAQLDETFGQRIPLGRVGHPEDVANAVLFLASDESSFMTGTEIFVDGGQGQV